MHTVYWQNDDRNSALTRRISTCLAFVVSSRGRSPWWFDVVVGAILVFAAALARIAILGPASERLAYLTFWPIVLLAAFVGGLPAGLTVVALSAWLVHSAFVPLEDVADWAGLAVFLVAGGFCVGLTELFLRTRAEIFALEETQSAKAHLAAIVESSIDPILSKGLDGTITSWNSAAARSFGYDAAEILGKPIALLIPPALAAEEAEIVSRLKRGERIKGLETARVAKNGRVVDVSLTISPIRDHDGAISGASTIVRDITAKIQAERDLRASEQRLRLAAETTGVGVWEWNVERNTIIWDAQMFRNYGVTPTPGGAINPLVLAAAHIAGVDEIWLVGGAQAIAALAYGTARIRPVDVITGPGNAWVAEAKRQLYGVVGIDMVAGPSEILVIADGRNDPVWIAADLLSQAEHDPAAQSILITDDAGFADAVIAAVEDELRLLPKAQIARESWNRFGTVILVESLDQAPALANRLAAEHIEIATDDPDALFAQIRHAGSAFLGRMTP